MRFKDDDDSYSKTIYESICDISTGNKNTQDRIDNGIYPFYVRSNTIERINNYTFDGEAILTAGDGVGVGKVFHYAKGKIGVHQRVYLLSNFRCCAKYLFYHFSSRFYDRVKIMSAKNSVDSVRYDMIAKMKIYLPAKTQIQEKVANFFSLLDQCIYTQNKIIEDLELFKNSIMDDLLTKNYFIEMSLSDFVSKGYARIIKSSELTKFNGEKSYLSTSSIDSNGIVNIECKITYYNRPSRASMIPIKNSVWFAKMKDTIKVYKSENNDENKYVLSTGFYGILCDENKVSSDWILEIFKSNYFNNQKNRFSEGSSMSGIKDNQLEDIQVKIFSNKNEEIKFCKLSKLLNRKLKAEQLLLEKLKEQKKYLLSNMFI